MARDLLNTPLVETNAPRQRVLLAEDERVTRRILEAHLTRFGYDVISVENGLQAWDVLEGTNAPHMVLLDWNMPGIDGMDLCRRIRAREATSYTYTLLMTASDGKADVVAGLDAGADDFISKPIDPAELKARLNTGKRIIKLEEGIAELQGMLAICMHCKRIRNGDKLWEQLEVYIERNSGAKFSHGLCTDCLDARYPEGD